MGIVYGSKECGWLGGHDTVGEAVVCVKSLSRGGEWLGPIVLSATMRHS